MKHPLNSRLLLLICLAPVVLTGCHNDQNGYTPDQQKMMKSGQAPQITPDQRARMEAAMRGHMGGPAPAAAPAAAPPGGGAK